MIIKSMSRKVPSFGQLLEYIDRESGQEDFTIRHNLSGRKRESIKAEFERNAELLQKRKNGTYLFHEILSITRARGLSAEEQKERLHEIAREYISARCPDNLVYGGLHEDKDHSYHMHLMISANRAGEVKRQRLTKHQFRDIQVKLEAHVLQTYPELEQKLAIGKRSDRGRRKGEAELERRTGQRPKREEILTRVQIAYAASQDRDSLLSALGRENLELYVRGKTVGVVDLESGKKHRLKTLDLEIADRIEIRLAGQEVGRQAETEKSFEGEKEKRQEGPRERKGAEKAGPQKTEAKEQDMPSPEDRSQQDDEIPDWAIKAAEKAHGGPGKASWLDLTALARKIADQGIHEAKIVGKLARQGILGEEKDEKQFGIDEPEQASDNQRSDTQKQWKEDIQKSRGKDRDGPEQGRE